MEACKNAAAPGSRPADDKTRIRLEIIFSQALQEDFEQEFKKHGIGKHFTGFSNVTGAGFSNPRLGDSVWPQLNMMYIIYCDTEEAKKIRSVIKQLRQKYLTEGIACFMSRAVEL